MGNRSFSWMNPKLEVRDTGNYGKGLFAKEEIRKNELITILGGYAMTLEEFFKLPPDIMHYSSQIAEEFVFGIKSKNEEDDACFVNHSCNPNAGFKGQIFLVAKRKIRIDEEVTYDYAMELHPSKTPNPSGVQRFDTMECECGARNCRKLITEYDWKRPDLQKRYDGYFQWYIQDKIDRIKKRNESRKKH